MSRSRDCPGSVLDLLFQAAGGFALHFKQIYPSYRQKAVTQNSRKDHDVLDDVIFKPQKIQDVSTDSCCSESWGFSGLRGRAKFVSESARIGAVAQHYREQTYAQEEQAVVSSPALRRLASCRATGTRTLDV